MPVTLLAALGGALLGAATLYGQSRFGEVPNAFLDSVAVWVAVAYAAGTVARSRAHAAAAGLIACLAEIVAYYVAAAALHGTPGPPDVIAYWTACAFPGGIVFGLAGRLLREGGWRELAGAAALPAAFAVEGLYTYMYVEHREQAGTAWVAIALALAAGFLLAQRANRPGARRDDAARC